MSILDIFKKKKEHYKYYEWDKDSFVFPSEWVLDNESDLGSALKVFYAAGGYDFFNVIDPEYYASNWLDFVGDLYAEIMDDKYLPGSTKYVIPLTDAQKQELAERGVPEVFVTDI